MRPKSKHDVDAIVFWAVTVFVLILVVFSTGYSAGFSDGSMLVNR